MIAALIPLLAGALFGAGVCISGMVRPSKVIGFLDLGGPWDPSLALVMASALVLTAVTWRIVGRLRAPLFAPRFPDAPSTTIDRRLVVGAALFGIGWGISGFCPGPAIVSLVSGARASLVFVGAMCAAMFVFQRLDQKVEDDR